MQMFKNRKKRFLMSIFMLLVMGRVQAQTDYTGTWYISNGNNSGYYLVPSVTGYWQDNDATPYVTTYKTNKDANSIWRFEKVTEGDDTYYRIIHNLTGKYLTFNNYVEESNPYRLRFHLESTNAPGDATLFVVQKHTTNAGIAIRAKGYDGSDNANRYVWLDVSSGNKDNYWNGNSEGCIGVWQTMSNVNSATNRYLEAAPQTCATPVITHNGSSFTISYPIAGESVSIHYTTDGSEPTTASPLYGGAIAESGVTMVRAIAVKTGYSNSYEARLYAPNKPFMFKTIRPENQSYYIVPPLDETSTTDLYATTTNVPDAKMAWLLKSAGTFSGTQFYYIVNAVTGKYMYCRVTRNNQNAIEMRPLGEAGTEESRYQFCLYEKEGYTLIAPKTYAQYAPSTGSQNLIYKNNGDNHTDYIALYSDNDNCYPRWKIMPVPSDPKTLWPLDDYVSTDAATTYWNIQSVNDNSYYVCPPTGTSRIASARQSGDNLEWLIEQATDDDSWTPYWHIRNGETGKYLYFRGIAGQQNTYYMQQTDSPSDDDGYKFIIVRTANASAANSYNIIPKALKDQPNQIQNALHRNGNTLQSWYSRNNSNAQWDFVQVDNFVSPPVFAQSTDDGPVSLTCITAGATIYYTTDGSDPATSGTRQAYASAIVPAAGAVTAIKACAVREGQTSTVVMKTVDLTTRATGYYALHQSGTGYLKISGSDAYLGNEGTLRSDDLFNYGSSIWVVTEEGYLQNHYYYLNVANNRTLYLSDTPRTRWSMETVAGSTKKHLYINDGTKNLYLCYDGGVTLSATTTRFYSACPLTMTERSGSWAGPTTTSLTLLSPQKIDQLRHYFTYKMDCSWVNDDGNTATSNSNELRAYATLEYVSSSSAGKGTTWDIADNIIYSKQSEGNVEVSVTCRIQPADPIARAAHPETVEREITFTLQPRAMTPDAGKDYLMFSTNNENHRFPFDDGIPEGQPVKSYGTKTKLTWPENTEIAWKIEADERGFVMFKNVNTGHYLYYDAEDYSSSDYGLAKMGGATPSDDRYKFRLYRWGVDGTYGEDIMLILPYDKQFVVYKSDGRAGAIYSALYPDWNNRVLSASRPADNTSKWKFYPYEVESDYRLKSNFTIGISNDIKASDTRAVIGLSGTYSFSAQSYHWRSIKDAPENNTQLEIYGTGTYPDITYTWTVGSLDSYVTTTAYTSTGANKSSFSVTVETLPSDTAKGTLHVVASVSSPEAKQVPITIDLWLCPGDEGPAESDFTEITTLSAITDSKGLYRLVSDNPSGTPAVSVFSGYLDGGGHTISGLTTPLFATLAGKAVVRNINFDQVNISDYDGNAGTVAGVATDTSRIYNIGILSGSVGSSNGYCGGIAGQIEGYARVINCFSYADITGGTDVGGIVGYNSFASKKDNVRTMVMNCMYYGERVTGANVSPIYGGVMIPSSNNNSGVTNYNYFSNSTELDGNVVYNCALEMEQRYMDRFEFYRLLLNSNRELAGWYATGKVDRTHSVMGKWVIETADRTIADPKPYPVLKPHGQYPSIINPDAAHAPADAVRNEGGVLEQLAVNVQMGSGNLFSAPAGAAITTSTLTLNITDKDTTRYNYNYRKVQLPYYNDLGTLNYTNNRVVAGWKIVAITGGTRGTFAEGDDATIDDDGNITATPYNFADRQCTDKDLYAVSGRVFNQGAYWDVPDGVTAISIEPYWAKCAYLSDPYHDEIYNGNFGGRSDFTLPGIRFSNDYDYHINGDVQRVYTNHTDALRNLERTDGATVYDYALVLVGNYHHRLDFFSNDNLPYTYMSADLDYDNEPDYSDICQTANRQGISPIRYDFINSIGLGMAQKPNGGTRMAGWGIPFPLGWFEITNTTLIRFTEFEADGNNGKAESPIILQGGIYEQFVSMKTGGGAAVKTSYLIVGGNAWFSMFNNGSHGNNGSGAYTRHTPVNVLGGDYDIFYLTGYFNTVVNTRAGDNAECYVSGGRFGEMAGAGMEGVGGNVAWKIYGADISNFYGGGINVDKPILGNIAVDIVDSHIGTYCGGPKFGDMQQGKAVTTVAKGCHIGTFFGAGYGGTAYTAPRLYDRDPSGWYNYPYNEYIEKHYNRGYRTSYGSSEADQTSAIACNGISVDYEYELFAPPGFNASQNVCRFRIRYASLSLAITHNVTSRLTGCTITGNFYGGGNLGKVDGNVTSTLNSCTVSGNVYGAGFSAQAPICPVMPKYAEGKYDPLPYYNTETGAYSLGVKTVGGTPSNGVPYTWHHTDAIITDGSTVFDETNHYILTNVDMSNLGVVSGTATLSISGKSLIGLAGEKANSAEHGNVYGGGEESAVGGDTKVSIMRTTEVMGNVYGGGNMSNVGGGTQVIIGR